MLTDYEKIIGSQSPKTWLVTGAAGFIGSHLVHNLLLSGQKVVGLDNLSTGSKLNIDLALNTLSEEQIANFAFIEGDITDKNICNKSVEGVNVVLHQAALGSVPRSIKDPRSTHNNNVNGFFNILEASRQASVQNVVYASSSSVYGDSPKLPKREGEFGKLLSSYAGSKYINEVYSSIYTTNYSMNLIGLRYFNVFGPRQNPEGEYAAVIPKWINLMLENKEVEIYGDGQNSRDFCFIDNVVEANILSGISKNTSDVLNIACHDRITLIELFDLIKNILNEDYNFKYSKEPSFMPPRSGDIKHSFASIDRANKVIGYEVRVKFKEGLKKTVHYFVNKHKAKHS